MKCQNCGAPVSYEQLECPYCGTANPEAIAFQKEILEKMERNRLLGPFLRKQKTPELVLIKLLILCGILFVVNIGIILACVGIHQWSEKAKDKGPEPGTFAAKYQENFGKNKPFEEYFYGDVENTIEFMEDGSQYYYLHEVAVENMLSTGQTALEEYYEKERDEDGNEIFICTDEERASRLRNFQRAFYMGYLGLSEEDLGFMEKEEDETYVENGEERKAAATVIYKLLQEVENERAD
ncbi:MAG: hypothetical protein IKY23_09655 [Lachnospiraceae bacterium]|nr:hypothetical protein [Lachnospiraceae bacterium]